MKYFGRVWRATIFRPDGSALRPAAPGENVDLNPLSIDPVTALVIDMDFRMTFAVEKKLEKNPNTCDMTIYNLADATRALVKQRPLSVKLEAGYDGVLRHVFTGDIRFSDSILKDTTWETKLQLKDGGRAYANGFCSKTFSKGTRLSVALRDIAKEMGLELPPNVKDARDLNVQIAKSLTVDEPARDALTRELAARGYSWSIQNGLLQILKDTEVREDYAFIINDESAMVDTPAYATPDKKGGKPKLTFKTLLRPELQPGSKVDMQAREVRGFHKIIALKHSGDTDEAEWWTTCEAKQL